MLCLSFIDCHLAFSLLYHWLIDFSFLPSRINDYPVFDIQVARLSKPRSIASALLDFTPDFGIYSVINSTSKKLALNLGIIRTSFRFLLTKTNP